MNGQIQAQSLQCINKKSEQGFTLTELVVVFFIIGILSAIALPNLLAGSCKRVMRRVVALSTISAMNRAQQAYFLKHKKFAKSIEEMGVVIKETQTEDFSYSIKVNGNYAAFNYATPTKKGEKQYKSYVGGIFFVPPTKVVPKAKNDERLRLTQAVLCGTYKVTNSQAADPLYKNDEIVCDESTKDFSK